MTAQGIEMVSGVPVFIGIDPVGIDRGFTVPDPTNSGNETYETSSRAELVQSNRTTPKSYNGHKVTESVSRTEVPPTQEKQGSHTARPHATDSIAYTHNSSVVPDGSNSLSNSPDISLSSTTTTSGHQSTESKPVTSDPANNQTDTMASEESTHTTTTRERQAFSGIVTTSRPTTLSSVEVMTSRFSQGSKNATFNFTSHHSTSLPTKTDTSPTSAKGYRSDKSTITYLSTKASSATNPTSVKPVQRSSNLIHLTSRPISPTTTSVIGRIPEVSAPPSTSDASTVKLLVAVTASNAYTTVAREERTAAVKTHGFKTTAVPTVSEQDSRSTLAAATSKQEAKDPTLYWSQTHMDTEPATAPSIGHATGRYTPTVAFNPNGTTSERLNDTIRTSQDDPKRHSEPPTTATQKGDSRTPSDQRYNIATTSRPVYERSLVSERTERQMVGRTSRPNIPDSTNSGFNTKQMFVEVSTERNTDKLTIVQDPLSSTTSVLRDKSTSISNTDVTLSTVKPQPRVVSSAEMVTGQTTSSSVKASASSAAAYPLITTIKLLSNVSVSLTNAKMENTPSTASASEVSNMTAPHGSVKFGLTTAEKSVPTVTPIDISTRSSNGALSESSTGTRHQSPYDTTSGGIWLTSSRRSATREASKDLSATSPHVSTTVRITEHVTNRSLTESVGTLLTTQRPALPSGPHAEKINVTDKQVTDMLEISTASFRTDLNISTSSPREHAATTSASYVQGDLSSSLTTIISMFKTYSDKGTKTPVDRVSQTVSQISTVPGISENTTQLNESVTSAASASKFIVTYPVEVRENATVPSTSQDEDIFTTRGQNANIATNFTQSLENGSVVTFPSVTLTAGRSSLTGNFSDPTTPNINVKPYTTGPLLHNLTTYGAYEVHVTTEPLKPTKISTIQSPVSNHSTILESRSPVSYTTLSSIMATWRENTSSSVVSSNSALQSSTELGFSIRQSGTESRYHVLDNVTSSAPRAFSVSGSKEVVLNVTAPRVESSTLGMLYGNASTLGGSSAIVTPTPDANFTSSQALLNVSGSTEDTHSNASSLGFTSSPILNSTLVTDVSYGPGLSGYTDVSTKNTGLITSNMPTNSSSPNGASNIPIKLTTEGLEQKNASSIESQVSVSVSDSMSPHQEKITFSSSPPHHPESATSSTSQDQNASAAFAYNSTYYVPPGTATTSEPSFFPHIGITTSKTSYSNKSSLVTQVQTSGTPSPVSSTRSPFIPDTLTSRISFQPQNNFSRTTPASEYSNDTYFESSSGSIQPEVATVSSKHASGLLTSTPGIGNRTVSQPSAIYTSQSVDANITIRTTDTYPTQGSGKPTVLTESGASGPPPSPESDLSSYSPMASTASEESGKQRSIDTTARHPGTSSEIRTSTQAAITKAGLTDSAASTSISTNGTTDSTRHSTAMDETITINSTHMQVHVGTEATIVAEDVSTMLSINSTSLSPISTSYISDHRMSSSLVTSPPATETGISSPIYPSSLLSSASVKGLSTVASNHSVTNVTENNNLLSTVTSSPATHYPTSRTFSAKRDDYISSTVQLTTQDDSHGISTAVEFATRLIPNSTEYLSTTMFHVNSTTNISDRPTSAAWTEGGPVELNGQLRLRRQWMRDLENPTSEEYRRLDSQISTIVSVFYFKLYPWLIIGNPGLVLRLVISIIKMIKLPEL